METDKKRGYGPLLRLKGFPAFLGTQFLGALNDNLLKYVIIFLAGAGMLRGGSGNAGLDIATISLFAVLPALLFTGLAGYLADNFEKRRVLIVTKSFEILIMLLAWPALRSGGFQPLLAVLFLLATQFTFFGPSKYGVLPELVGDAALSKANGLLEMSTFLAILLGSVLAAPLFTNFRGRLDVIAAVILGVAVLGSGMSFGIAPTRRPTGRAPLRLRLFWSEVLEGTRLLRADRRLRLANFGAAYFWFQGALFQMAMVLLGEKTLHLDEGGVTCLFMALALGIGVGSLLAGLWSGPIVELGLVPLGSLGMGLCAAALGLAAGQGPGAWTLGLSFLALFGVGVSAGFFVVPLNALLQQRAAADAKGRVQAAANFFSTLAMVLAALVYGLLSKRYAMPVQDILLSAGLVSLAVSVALPWALPEFLLRACLWLARHSLRRLRVEGLAALPSRGGALLLCGGGASGESLLIQAGMQRQVRFVIPQTLLQEGLAGRLYRVGRAIPLEDDGTGALRQARLALEAGQVVCVFKPALGSAPDPAALTLGLDVPILEVRLDSDGPRGRTLLFQAMPREAGAA